MLSLAGLNVRRAQSSASDVSRCCGDGEVGGNVERHIERHSFLPRRTWRDAVDVSFCGSDNAILGVDVSMNFFD